MTHPVTLMVARRVANGCYEDFLEWLREGERLATHYEGYLGSGVLSPPPGDNEVQIIFRFSNDLTLSAWEHSSTRQRWLEHGQGLFEEPQELRAQGIDAWFGDARRTPPRWKQSIAVWLAFFPVSLVFNALLGETLAPLPLIPRILFSTLVLTPIMVCLFIPWVTRLLSGWLNSTPATTRRRPLRHIVTRQS
jgi:antibiotic biosynthesis monooxygenase (ABM) superfamily enzyme